MRSAGVRRRARPSRPGRAARCRRGSAGPPRPTCRPDRRAPSRRTACRGRPGRRRRSPSSRSTSAARTISSAHGWGSSRLMSMPFSAIAATAAWLSSAAGSEPPEKTSTRSPARWRIQPAAICDRPALWTHRNSTLGLRSVRSDSSRTSARRRSLVRRSTRTGTQVVILAFGRMQVERLGDEALDRLDVHAALPAALKRRGRLADAHLLGGRQVAQRSIGRCG